MTHGKYFGQVQGANPAVQLKNSQLSGIHFIIIKALPGNTGTVYIDTSAVTNGNTGFPLNAGEQLGPIPHDDFQDLYVFSAGTDKVAIVALGKGVS